MRIGNVNHPNVNPAQYQEMTRLVEGMLGGDRIARLHLMEHFTTGDSSIYALAALTNAQVIQNYEKASQERQWNKIAQVESVDDFETPRLYTFEADENKATGYSRKGKNGKSDNPAHIPPVVPEGTTYPTFNLKAERLTSEFDFLPKRGGRYSMSWERFIKDPDNIIARLPQLFTEQFLDAEDWEVWSTLRSVIDTKGSIVNFAGGTTAVFGTTVPAKAKISRDALEVGLREMKTREYNGVPMNLTQFKLIVPLGAADGIRQALALWIPTGIKTDPTSGVEYSLSNPEPWNPLSSFSEIIETEYFTGDEWAIIVAPGTDRRPGLQLLKLRGHETPDIRIKGDQGFRPGGGSVGVFEGSFDTDDIEIRGRLPIQGVSWTAEHVLYSDGTGV